jgi:hypothetical protein
VNKKTAPHGDERAAASQQGSPWLALIAALFMLALTVPLFFKVLTGIFGYYGPLTPPTPVSSFALPTFCACSCLAAIAPTKRWRIGMCLVVALCLFSWLFLAQTAMLYESAARPKDIALAWSGHLLGGVLGLVLIPRSHRMAERLVPVVVVLAVAVVFQTLSVGARLRRARQKVAYSAVGKTVCSPQSHYSLSYSATFQYRRA